MYQLLYVSSASNWMSDDKLDSLLVNAKANNHNLDVTGMLVYHDGSFIQILEGEKDQVESLFNKISKDARHNNIILIDEKNIDMRSFSSWDMAFRKLTKSDLEKFPSVSSLINNSTQEKTGKLTDIVEAFLSLSVI